MPEDSRIIKLDTSNGTSPELKDMSLSLEELDQLIRQWVKLILSNIEPPPGLWERIKRRAQHQNPMGNSCGS